MAVSIPDTVSSFEGSGEGPPLWGRGWAWGKGGGWRKEKRPQRAGFVWKGGRVPRAGDQTDAAASVGKAGVLSARIGHSRQTAGVTFRAASREIARGTGVICMAVSGLCRRTGKG